MSSSTNTLINKFYLKSWDEHQRRDFRRNLLFGAVLLLLVWWVEGTGSGEVLNNVIADAIMKIEYVVNSKLPDSLAFIDIDYATELEWNGGKPYFAESVPRDSVARIIQEIASDSVSVLVVDMAFTQER